MDDGKTLFRGILIAALLMGACTIAILKRSAPPPVESQRWGTPR